jgi:signal transduction histidine kinase
LSKRKIIFYWITILVPAFIIGACAVILLSHEQDRRNMEAIQALESRAESIADSIGFTVETLKDELIRSLAAVDENNIKNSLVNWKNKNPLIRNIFIWDRNERLLFPEDSRLFSSEERLFVKRYQALFSKRIPFEKEKMDNAGQGKTSSESSGKKELLKLASQRTFIQERDYSKESKNFSSGWIPWYMENSLYLLGWVSRDKKAPVYGVEIEMVTLISRLITDFPLTTENDMVFALVDGKNQVIHQSGPFEIKDIDNPFVSVPLSGSLPLWKISVYTDGSLSKQSSGFFYLSLILVLIFLSSIISGGVLIFKQAQKNYMEAMQKTSFVASVSHELKTPLTSIRMYSELLSCQKVNDEKKLKKYADVIKSESERLTRLVNNILDFSSLEQGRKKYCLTEFDLGEFIKNFSSIHRQRFFDEGIELYLDLAEDKYLVKTDRDCMEQVFLNLSDNIIKYAAEGKHAVIKLRVQKDSYNISFIDRGPGIPHEHRKKIFEKFHRVDTSLTAEKSGSGLGLAITAKILDDLGGDLVFTPVKEGGSCFTVIIST